MKILIMTVTAGNGHNATAVSLKECFETQGANVVIQDIYQYAGKLLFDTIDKGYRLASQYLRKPYKSAYTKLENIANGSPYASLISSKPVLAHKFKEYFETHRYDVIICTHIFAAIVIDELKNRSVLDTPTIGINTDYCIHPFWESVDRIEYIVISGEELMPTALRRGIRRRCLLPLGIPVNEKFRSKVDAPAARRALGLDEDKSTVLIMGGGMGYGYIEENVRYVDRLDIDVQLVCVAGNNSRLLYKLEQVRTRHPVYLRGFVDNVETYMDAANCLVTKPGGITVSEALVKKLPMILVNPLPGQEERNTEFLRNYGVAMQANPAFPAPDIIQEMLSNPVRVEMMRRLAELIAKPDATRDICEFALRLGGGAENAGSGTPAG